MKKELKEVVSILEEIITDKNLHPFKPTLNQELSEAKEILIKLLKKAK